MRLGALLTPAQDAQALCEQARNFEAAGYTSIWSAHAMGRGFMLTDPFIALTAAATATTTVELGTAILQLPHYNPTDVALKALSLQQLAAGRFRLGLGVGSTEADFQVHGTPFGSRFEQFDARLDSLRIALTDGSANGGNLSPPAQVLGNVPLLFGTWGKNVARAAGEFDGWIASGMHRTPLACCEALKGYRAAGGARAIVSTIQVMPNADLGKLKDDLATYRDGGFDDAVIMIFPGGPSIDDVRALI